jgi:hypothetical protein
MYHMGIHLLDASLRKYRFQQDIVGKYLDVFYLVGNGYVDGHIVRRYCGLEYLFQNTPKVHIRVITE